MAMFILLTEAQAAEVRGPALDPVEHAGGTFILNVLVLSDPAHAEHHDTLAALPRMDSSDPAFPPEKE